MPAEVRRTAQREDADERRGRGECGDRRRAESAQIRAFRREKPPKRCESQQKRRERPREGAVPRTQERHSKGEDSRRPETREVRLPRRGEVVERPAREATPDLPRARQDERGGESAQGRGAPPVRQAQGRPAGEAEDDPLVLEETRRANQKPAGQNAASPADAHPARENEERDERLDVVERGHAQGERGQERRENPEPCRPGCRPGAEKRTQRGRGRNDDQLGEPLPAPARDGVGEERQEGESRRIGGLERRTGGVGEEPAGQSAAEVEELRLPAPDPETRRGDERVREGESARNEQDDRRAGPRAPIRRTAPTPDREPPEREDEQSDGGNPRRLPHGRNGGGRTQGRRPDPLPLPKPHAAALVHQPERGVAVRSALKLRVFAIGIREDERRIPNLRIEAEAHGKRTRRPREGDLPRTGDGVQSVADEVNAGILPQVRLQHLTRQVDVVTRATVGAPAPRANMPRGAPGEDAQFAPRPRNGREREKNEK